MQMHYRLLPPTKPLTEQRLLIRVRGSILPSLFAPVGRTIENVFKFTLNKGDLMKVNRLFRSIVACSLVTGPLIFSTSVSTAADVTFQIAAPALTLGVNIADASSAVTGASFVTKPNGPSTALVSGAFAGFPREGAGYVVMSTGDVRIATNANASTESGVDLGGGRVRGNSDFDVTILKLDISVPSGANCLLGLDFRFMSEEYPEFVGSEFNDAFIAELDQSTWTTSGSQIVAPRNFAFDPSQDVISINSSGATAMSVAEAAGTTFDGATKLLSAATPITPGAHSIYLSIFDQGDGVLDSAVIVDALRVGRVANPATQCRPGAVVASERPDFGAWTTGDVHTHVAGDTSLLLHPVCDLLKQAGTQDCSSRMVDDVKKRAAVYSTDWVVLTEHSPWLGYLRRGVGLNIYDPIQGAAQWAQIFTSAANLRANPTHVLLGNELGTSAPACMGVTSSAIAGAVNEIGKKITPKFDPPQIRFDTPAADSPGHFGVYSTPRYIVNNIFDCLETGPSGYAGVTQAAGGFGGLNHPRNKDGGSRWHCWTTNESKLVVGQPDPLKPAGNDEVPITGGNLVTCPVGVDFHGTEFRNGLGSYRTVELISGENLPMSRSLDHWDSALQNGLFVAAVGGGDGHTVQRKQGDPSSVISCKDEKGTELACGIDKGGAPVGVNAGKIGGSGRTMTETNRAPLDTVTPTDPNDPVRQAMLYGRTVATNGPRVIARVGTAGPGGFVEATSASSLIRVDWEEAFLHSGDEPSYCFDADKVSREVVKNGERKVVRACPDSFNQLTFSDVQRGTGFRAAQSRNEAPDSIVVVVGPVNNCGTKLKTCRETRTRIPYEPTSTDIQNKYAEIPFSVPSGSSYVRVETYYDTGDLNKPDDRFYNNKNWDFAAFASPIFLSLRPVTAATFKVAFPTRPTDSTPAAAAKTVQASTSSAATPEVRLVVADIFGTPVPSVSAVVSRIDPNGGGSSPIWTGSTGVSGTANVAVQNGGIYGVTVNKPGCDQRPIEESELDVAVVPIDKDLVAIIDCHVFDNIKPTIAIVAGPSGTIASSTATFDFAAADNNGNVTIGCVLEERDFDDFSFDVCDSHQTFIDLEEGWHTVTIVAFDATGNTSSPLTRKFYVRTKPTTSEPRCALCVTGTSGTTISLNGNSNLDVETGNVLLSSNSASSIRGVGRSSVTSSGVVRGPGGSALSGAASVSPVLSTGGPAPDTHPELPATEIITASGSTCEVQSTSVACAGTTKQGNELTIPEGDYSTMNLANAGAVSIGPGTYKNLTISGSTTVRLRAGDYTVNALAISGATATGYGVRVHFACLEASCAVSPRLAVSNNGRLSIEAPYDDQIAIVATKTATSVTVSGNSELKILGDLHGPEAELTLTASTMSARFSTLRTVSLVGNASMRINADLN